jgi:hypothetical protein
VSALLDGRGCLTEAGFVALDSAAPGRGPAEAAAHLVACARCQRRFLARGGTKSAGISATPGKAVAPPRWRAVAILLAALVLVTTALIGVRWLAAR